MRDRGSLLLTWHGLLTQHVGLQLLRSQAVLISSPLVPAIMAMIGRGIRGLVSLRAFQPSGGPWHHASSHRSINALVEDNTDVLDVRGTHPLSANFQENAKAMEALISRLNINIARACEGGGLKAIERNAARGKLLPRQRIAALLDPGSPFLELSQLAGHNLYGTASCRYVKAMCLSCHSS